MPQYSMSAPATTVVSTSLAWRRIALSAGRWCMLLSLASVSINKPAINIFLFLALLGSAFGEEARARFSAALREPIVQGCIALFVVLFLTALHAPGDSERWGELGAHKALFYPLIIASLFRSNQWRDKGLLAFAVGAGIVLVLSLVQVFPTMDAIERWGGGAGGYTVFFTYTQQGLALVMLGALAASFAFFQETPARRLLFAALLLAVCVDVIILLQSRTAYLVLPALIIYAAYTILNKRLGRAGAIAIAAVIAVAIVAAGSLAPRAKARVVQAQTDVTQYQDNATATSMGVRLEVWRRTLPMIADAPLFGHGLGQWAPLYREQTKDVPNFQHFRMGHPHQEALWILSEAGVIGFAAFAALLIALLRTIRAMERPHRDFFTALWLVYVVAGIANCLLLDFTERHLFLLLLACAPLPRGKSSPA